MSVRTGQSVRVEFITANPSTNAAVDADSLPTAILVINGTDNGASVTVTHVDTGRYKVQVTLPTLATDDIVEIVATATLSSVVTKQLVWRDTKDIAIPLVFTDDGYLKTSVESIESSVHHADLLKAIVEGTGTVVSTLADGAITEAKITPPSEASGRPTGTLAMIRRIFEWTANKRTRDRATGSLLLRNASDNGTLETQVQSTSSNVDTITKGV